NTRHWQDSPLEARYFRYAALGCPKTFPPCWPQTADSMGICGCRCPQRKISVCQKELKLAGLEGHHLQSGRRVSGRSRCPRKRASTRVLGAERLRLGTAASKPSVRPDSSGT